MNKNSVFKILTMFIGTSLIIGCSKGGERNSTIPGSSNIPASSENHGNSSNPITSNGDNDSTSQPIDSTVPVTMPQEVTLNSSDFTLEVGGTKQLSANVLPSQADQSIEWSTLNPAVATVTNGLVTAISVGTIEIKATSAVKSSVFTTVTVTVIAATIPVTSVTIDDKSITTILVGDTLTLTATAGPSNATNKNITWESSDTTVATVTNGAVKGIKGGSAVITAKSASNASIKDTLSISVSYPEPTDVVIAQGDTATIENGRHLTLITNVLPSGALQEVEFESSNPSIATITADGRITAVAEGDATIIVKAKNKLSISKEIDITVIAALTRANATFVADSLATSYGTGTLTVKDSQRFDFAFAYIDTSRSTQSGYTGNIQMKNTSYISNSTASDLFSVEIVNKGYNKNLVVTAGPTTEKMTAVVPNEDTLVYEFDSGSKYFSIKTNDTHYFEKIILTYTASDVVIAPERVTITNGTSANLFEGGTLQLSATVEPYAASQIVKWASDDNAIATVDEDTGLVTAIAAGEAIITAACLSDETITNTITIIVIPDQEPVTIKILPSNFGSYPTDPTTKTISYDTDKSFIFDYHRIMKGNQSGTDVIQLASTSSNGWISNKTSAELLELVIKHNTGGTNFIVKAGATSTSATTITPTNDSSTYTYVFPVATRYFILSNGSPATYFNEISLEFKPLTSSGGDTGGDIGGEDTTIKTLDITATNLALTSTSTTTTKTVDGKQFQIGQMRSSNTNSMIDIGGCFYNVTAFGSIKSIDIYYAAGGSGTSQQSIKFSGTSLSTKPDTYDRVITASVAGTNTLIECQIENMSFFRIDVSSKILQFSKIIITYTD